MTPPYEQNQTSLMASLASSNDLLMKDTISSADDICFEIPAGRARDVFYGTATWNGRDNGLFDIQLGRRATLIDTLEGGSGSDLAFRFGGDDTIVGASGVSRDGYDSGDGIDVYSSDTLGTIVNLSLKQNQAVGREVGTDQLSNFESIAGGSGDDRIVGDAGASILFGDDGNDTLDGGECDNWLLVGAGNDILTARTGSDTFILRLGEANGDVITDVADGDFNSNRVVGNSFLSREVNFNLSNAYFGTLQEGREAFNCPTAMGGTYFLSVCSATAGEVGTYMLNVTGITPETPPAARTVGNVGSMTASVETEDTDGFKVTITTGDTYHFESVGDDILTGGLGTVDDDCDGADGIDTVFYSSREVAEALFVSSINGADYAGFSSQARSFNVALYSGPLVLALDGDRVELTGMSGAGGAPVYWDVNNDGFREAAAWVKVDNGLLICDLNGHSIIDNRGELFAVATTDGFTSLAALDSNGVTAIDTNWVGRASRSTAGNSNASQSSLNIVVNETLARSTYSPSPASVTENAGTVTFTVTRSSGTAAECVHFSTAQTDGSGNSGDSAGLTGPAMVFAVEETSKTVTVSITNDSASGDTWSNANTLLGERSSFSPGETSKVVSLNAHGRTLYEGGDWICGHSIGGAMVDAALDERVGRQRRKDDARFDQDTWEDGELISASLAAAVFSGRKSIAKKQRSTKFGTRLPPGARN